MEKTNRTYFIFEQFDDRDPNVEAYGDPNTLLSAGLALVRTVLEDHPDKRRATRRAFRYVMRDHYRKMDKESKYMMLAENALKLIVGVLALFGAMYLFSLFMGKIMSLF